MILLEDAYKKIVTFLNKGKYKYIVIGGIAAGTIGEARVTEDVDIDIIIDKKKISGFLDQAAKAGFSFVKTRCLKLAEQTSVFQINYENFRIDFIIATTELEAAAFKRAQKMNLYGIKANFPTPEDLILLKIIPGRDKDLLDAKNIVERHKGKLDKRYLRNWAEKLCDEAEDMRISNVLNQILKD